IRTQSRSYASAATYLLAALAAVAPPRDDVTAAGAGPELLRALLADGDVSTLAEQAQTVLLDRIAGLFAVEVQRYAAPLSWVDVDLAPRMRSVAGRVREGRMVLRARGEDAA